MSSSSVKAVFPSGSQMASNNLSPVVVEQIKVVALQVLRKLLLPLVLLRRARRARDAARAAVLDSFPPGQLAAAVESALLYASALTQAMPALTESAAAAAAAASAAAAAAAKASSAGGDGQQQHRPAPPDEHSALSEEEATVPSPVAAAASRGRPPLMERRKHSVLDVGAADRAVAALHELVTAAGDGALQAGGVVSYEIFAQGEVLQWAHEPAHEVTVLLAGCVGRTAPVVAADAAEDAMSSPTARSRRVSSAIGNTAALSRGSIGGGANGGLPPLNSRLLGRRSVASGGAGGAAGAGSGRHGGPRILLQEDTLTAPVVLGELACVGGFPYCMQLVAQSAVVVAARIPREAYVALLAERTPLGVQRAMLSEALREREYLMPFFAPMTVSRLRLCPLLATLRRDDLAPLLGQLVPRVYAAGMLCSESEDPQHIFFVRRGVVRAELSGMVTVDASLMNLPRNRSVLVEGHTFGETPCIFREALGDAFYAFSHVDMYLLPFHALIQLMKRQPEVQRQVRACAKQLSLIADREFPGTRFGPDCPLTEVAGISGVVAGGAAGLAGAAGVSVGAAGAAGGFPAARRSSLMGGGGGGAVAALAARQARRVTIFAEGDVDPDCPLKGGKVTAPMLEAIKCVPLLSMVATEELLLETQRSWKCLAFDKGQYIVRRGEECNRLLFFYEGKAAIVADEIGFQMFCEAGADGPFGSPDIAAAGPEVLLRIPAGHTVGYTCVRRHRWTRSVVAVSDKVEVWELKRNVLIGLLRKHSLEGKMNAAALQLLQPLAEQRERVLAADYQPTLSPSLPSSLWSEHPLPRLHPVSRSAEGCQFPIWRDGDFPLDKMMEAALTSGAGNAGRAGAAATPRRPAHDDTVASVHTEEGKEGSGGERSSHHHHPQRRPTRPQDSPAPRPAGNAAAGGIMRNAAAADDDDKEKRRGTNFNYSNLGEPASARNVFMQRLVESTTN